MSAERRAFTPHVVVPMLLIVVAMPLLPLLISWRWGWWEARVWAGVSILGFAISRVLAVRRHPDLLTERAGSMQHENTKEWDKHLAPVVGFGSGLAAVVAGLDKRFAWVARNGSTEKRVAGMAFCPGSDTLWLLIVP